MKRALLSCGVAGALLLSLTAASPGGWATITVEDLPDYLVVRAPLNLTFAVRQHGVKLLPDLEPTVEMASAGVVKRVPVSAYEKQGYYTAVLSPDHVGDWTILIKSGFLDSRVKLVPIAATPAAARPKRVAMTERGRTRAHAEPESEAAGNCGTGSIHQRRKTAAH